MAGIYLYNPVTADQELEEVYNWFQMNLNEMLGPGRDLQGGPTWTLRDLLCLMRVQAPKAYGELLRKANS